MLNRAQVFYIILAATLICIGQVLVLKGSASERPPESNISLPEEYTMGCPMVKRDDIQNRTLNLTIQDLQNGPQGDISLKISCKYGSDGRLLSAEEYNYLRGYGVDKPTRWTVFNYGLGRRAARADLFDMTHSEDQAMKILLFY